jgi:hypothetical protein
MNADDPGFQYMTLIFHNGVPIGKLYQCATDDDSLLYDGALGLFGSHIIIHGVTRIEAIQAVERAWMS